MLNGLAGQKIRASQCLDDHAKNEDSVRWKRASTVPNCTIIDSKRFRGLGPILQSGLHGGPIHEGVRRA